MSSISKPLTLKAVRASLAPLFITIRKQACGDYVVRHKGSPVGHGYYTPDLQDALATGKRMARELYLKTCYHVQA